MSEGITVADRRPARKRTPAGASGLNRAGAIARAHPYRTVEERVARGLAWRETAPIEGHGIYAINRRRKSPVGILRAQDGQLKQATSDGKIPVEAGV